MDKPVEHGVCDGGIAEYLGMPPSLTGESLRSGSLTHIIRSMAAPFQSASAKRATRR
jgi:hypothetical protein